MKPSDVARILKIAPTTVRAWSTEYGYILSPNGAGGDGRFRDFSDDDLRVLYFVHLQKRASVPAEEIHEALRQMQTRGFDSLPFAPDRPNVAEVPMVPAAAASSALDTERRALLREITKLEERTEHLELMLTEEQAARRNDNDKHLRELGDVRADLREAKTLLELYKQGRLKPDNLAE